MNPQIKMRLANKGVGEFKAEAGTLWLYDVIASDDDEAMWFGGISPRQFMAALAATTGPVTIRVNSPGGSVFGAQAMVAAMRAHQEPITVQVDALAASAASVIACEAARLVMAPGAMMMIHRAWGMALGNEEDMRATADLLAKIDGQIAETYARRSEGDKEEYLDLMAAETWFTAQEAVDAKLADEVLAENNQRPQAKWDLSAYAKAPQAEPYRAPPLELVEVANVSHRAFEAGAEAVAEIASEIATGKRIAAREMKLAARLAANPI